MPLFSTPSPKDLALATWRHVQRPQYMAKIERDQRRNKAKSVHCEPNCRPKPCNLQFSYLSKTTQLSLL
jgi:hypothetical protein